jgi:hypothetical protein
MFVLFLITDALNVVFPDIISNEYPFKLSAFSRGICLITLVLSYLIYNYKKLSVWLIIILVSINFLFCYQLIYFLKDTISWSINLGKIIFPFFLFWGLSYLSCKNFKKIEIFFLFFIILQMLIVFLAFLFDWNIFLAYAKPRFGYSGLIFAQNEASFFYVIAGIFIFAKWIETKKKIFLLILTGIFACSLLLGAKAVYIFIISFIVYYFFFYISKYFKRKYLLVLTCLATILLFITCAYITGLLDFYINFYHKKGLITTAFSFRNELFMKRVPLVLENWTFINYLFGSMNPATSLIEMDIIDLFLFAGIIGSLVYYFMLFKTLFKFKRNYHLAWFLVIQFFLLGGLSGHVFSSGVCGTYLALLCTYLHKRQIENSNIENLQLVIRN